MRYASFRLNIKSFLSSGAAFFSIFLVIFAAVHILRAESFPKKAHDISVGKTVSAAECTPAEPAKPSVNNAEMNMEDVGGEFVSDCNVYDGELSVPAHISLERITISDTVTKPLDSARVSSLFGYRCNPVSGKYSFHSGYDLAAPHGANIYAMYSGKVTTASYDNGYGNYIIIEHDSGFQSLYAHCSELLCAKGDSVESGERIALVGSTGNSTGAHLHVEFRCGGKRFDPEWILGGIYN